MRNRKRIMAAALTAVLSAGLLAGCGGTGNGSGDKGNTAKKSDVKITLLNSKGEIQEGLETIAEQYKAATGVTVEIMACGAGESPFAKISSMYNSGNPPTLAMLDTTDVIEIAKEKAVDLSGEGWIKEIDDTNVTKIDGKVYSFPFCIEGRGIIYNKTAIDKTLGIDFDPSTINSYDSLKDIFDQLRAAGMENPMVVSKEDWSLGAHQLQYIYETRTGENAGSEEVIAQLRDGSLDLLSYDRFNQFMDTFDLFKEYNYNKKDPLAVAYDMDPITLSDGEAAFWFNGVWAWPNIVDSDGEGNEYGFLPFVLGNDTSDFANNKIEATASKQVMIDNVKATDDQKQAAKDFLNWLVYDEAGQKALVEECSIVPAAKNNPNAPSDPLGASLKEKMDAGETFPASAIVPGDHWSVLGSSMQKYLAGQSSREELAADIQNYWKNHQ